MNESTWFASKNIVPMFNYLDNTNNTCVDKERKYRLFAIACCRKVQHLIVNQEIRDCLDEAENVVENGDYPTWRGEILKTKALFARGQIKDMGYWHVAYASTLCLDQYFDPTEIAYNVSTKSGSDINKHREEQANLLRDIIGNPFKKFHRFSKDGLDSKDFMTPDVISLKNSAYFERNCDFTLDSEKLLLLADALEEAGLPNKKCEKCRGRGELSCTKCSGEGCSVYSVAANGPCTSGDACTFCGGRGEYKAKNFVKGRGFLPNSVISALRGWEICRKCLGTGAISIVNLPNSSGDSSEHPCSSCYGSSLGRGWIKNDRPKYRGFWPLDLLRETR